MDGWILLPPQPPPCSLPHSHLPSSPPPSPADACYMLPTSFLEAVKCSAGGSIVSPTTHVDVLTHHLRIRTVFGNRVTTHVINYAEIRSYWRRAALNQHDRCPYAGGNLGTDTCVHTHTHTRRMACGDEVRDRGEAPTSQGTPGGPAGHQKPAEGVDTSSSSPQRNPTLDSVRQYIPMGGASLKGYTGTEKVGLVWG